MILLVVGLISASWLSFTPLDHEIENTPDDISEIQLTTALNAVDTIKPIEPTPLVPLFPTPIEPIESDDMDFDLDEPMVFDHTFDMTFDTALEPIFNLNPVFDFEPMELNIMLDTIPAIQWEKFNEEFSKNFNENFNSQYMANIKVMQESMAVLEKTLSQLKHEELITKEVEEKIRRAEMIQLEQLQNLEKIHEHEAV